jgi:hypothetical protein
MYMKKIIVIIFIPIVINLILLSLALIGQDNDIFNVLWQDSNTYLYFTQNILFFIFTYPILYIIINDILYSDFYSNSLINLFLTPISRVKYILFKSF